MPQPEVEMRAGSLQRVLGPVGVSLLTLSVLSPGASVLVAGVDVVHRAGTWTALAFLLGGLLTLIFTLSQAELGAAFPLAGGDYATIGNALGPRAGFIQFGLILFGTPIFLALSAVGVSIYVRALAPGLPATGTAIAALVASAALAVLNIRTGAKLTGTFLVIELGVAPGAVLLDYPEKPRMLGLDLPVRMRGGEVKRLGAKGWPAAINLPLLSQELYESTRVMRVFATEGTKVPRGRVMELLG